jgi:hypothetical protein
VHVVARAAEGAREGRADLVGGEGLKGQCDSICPSVSCIGESKLGGGKVTTYDRSIAWARP